MEELKKQWKCSPLTMEKILNLEQLIYSYKNYKYFNIFYSTIPSFSNKIEVVNNILLKLK